MSKEHQLSLEEKGRSLKVFNHEWLTAFYGERCSDFDSTCSCCLAWMGYDLVFADLDLFVELPVKQKKSKPWYEGNRWAEVAALFIWSILIGIVALGLLYYGE